MRRGKSNDRDRSRELGSRREEKGPAALSNSRLQGVSSLIGATVALVGVCAGSASAQSQLVWSHASGPGNENWNPKVVSIGEHGTQVLSAFGPFTDFTRLFSAYDQNPPSPVWQDDASTATNRHRVASARYADVHATLHDVDAGGAFNTRDVIVKKYTSASSTPDWTYQFPDETNGHEATAVHVSADGQTIVALMHNMFTARTRS